jgi:hypothetical protein
MATAHDSDIHAVLRIVGADDFSDDGESGEVTVEGVFAAAIVAEIGMDSRAPTRMGLTGHPVRISRMGGLEIWCNGRRSQRGARPSVHRVSDRPPLHVLRSSAEGYA